MLEMQRGGEDQRVEWLSSQVTRKPSQRARIVRVHRERAAQKKKKKKKKQKKMLNQHRLVFGLMSHTESVLSHQLRARASVLSSTTLSNMFLFFSWIKAPALFRKIADMLDVCSSTRPRLLPPYHSSNMEGSTSSSETQREPRALYSLLEFLQAVMRAVQGQGLQFPALILPARRIRR
jgi:hypothetical protein